MRDRAVPLPRVLAPFVTERTRAKGHAYFMRGAVTSIDTTGSYLSAIVRGTRAYHVTIFPNEGGFTGSCDCPFFAEHQDICKHIWATILAADQSGMLASYGPETWLDVAGERPHAVKGVAKLPDPWERFLGGVLQQVAAGETLPAPRFLNGQVIYALDRTLTLQGQGVALTVLWRQRKKNGEWGKPQPLAITTHEIDQLPDPVDREILALLVGAAEHHPAEAYIPIQSRASFRLTGPLTDRTLWMLASSGRLMLRTGHRDEELAPIGADNGPPWVFQFDVSERADGSMQLSGVLARGEERMPVTEPQLVLATGHLIARGTLARLDHGDAFTWLAELRRTGPATFPPEATPALTEALVRSRVDPGILPQKLRYDVVDAKPRPRLHVARDTHAAHARPGDLDAAVTFDYDGMIVPAGPGSTAYDAERRRMIRRDVTSEQRHLDRLHQLGFRRAWEGSGYTAGLLVGTEQFDRAVRALVGEGWRVEAEGAVFRSASAIRLQVSSGIDWFELHGNVDFGDGASVPLTKLLASLKRGERSILLGDGTRGMVPDEWLRRYARIAGFGEVEGDHVRYRPSQTALLDALLEAQPAVSIDETFAKARDAMRSFSGIRHLAPPSSFTGRLRDYQMEALGWFEFLRRFGFGGCLADDMGLGKTVMVLALLDGQRQSDAEQDRRPSLAVVPRSLVFNWIAEAHRFAPELRVLDYTGPQRGNARLDDYDLVLTTYGTLRRDAPVLKDYEFDYLILDEAQAVKNAVTATAKAVRLLRGRHRLALSGTPVENHIGELWSLFEFLNPGLLGSSSAFERASAVQRRDSHEDLALLARALKPLILRRTKAQVAPELPERTEQTIHCELDPAQRAFYDELRTHYRSTLFARVERDGLNRSTIHVLEALLRLRQAASHAGLVDHSRAADPSAKFDLLVPRLAEIVEEGHKALVFSQFTQLLGLLKPRLDEAGIVYEYLDGKTRDREARVQRFGSDPACGVFLISLKAGGLGLNLTAAEYVFLLDPWWNPAAEAQAIDRAHRIGQARHVFAYRLIARDTVEEKVAELQASKRELADAILSGDPALIRNLRPEDLELLLS